LAPQAAETIYVRGDVAFVQARIATAKQNLRRRRLARIEADSYQRDDGRTRHDGESKSETPALKRP
jgi:hypothetical protein